jgi:hypothetical protein
MVHSISNNTACQTLHEAAYGVCESSGPLYCTLQEGVSLVCHIIAIPILMMAGEHLIEGIIEGIFTIKEASRRYLNKQDYLTVQDEDSDQIFRLSVETQERKTLSPPLWKRSMKSLQSLTTAVFQGGVGVAGLSIAGIFSESSCASFPEQCPKIAEYAVNACNWGNEFLISVIDQVIAQHFGPH